MLGRTVGRFRIVAKLGEGGMGSVWKAEDSLLGRSVALKFLPEKLAGSPEARRRFLREARAASALDHPGIETVFDAGESGGVVYIAFHLIDGESVHDRVDRGPFPLPEAVRVLRAAAEALGHAHARGILHRDLSSRNIMLARDWRVILIDFGLARFADETRLTRTGTTLGTTGYMAPEVIGGGEADARTDLYGLGVVFYKMLTGALPFEGERPEALLYATVHQEPQAPSLRRAAIPAEIDRIALRLLAKQPGARFQSAEELLAAIGGGDAPGAAFREGDRVPRPGRSEAPTMGPEAATTSVPGLADHADTAGAADASSTGPARIPASPEPMSAASERSGAAPEPIATAPGRITSEPEWIGAPPGRTGAVAERNAGTLERSAVAPEQAGLAPQGAPRARPSWGRRAAVGFVAIVTLTALAVLVSFVLLRRSGEDAVGTAGVSGLQAGLSARFAVLPFTSVGEAAADHRYLADGISEALITKLTETGLQLIPWMTASRYTDTSRSLVDLAKELGVDGLILGTLRASVDRVHVSVSLVDGKTGLQSWADEIDEARSDLMAAQSLIALKAAGKLKGKLTAEDTQALRKAPSRSVEAYECYLKGQEALGHQDKESGARALGLFQKAAELDPGLAEAYVGIGAAETSGIFNGWSATSSDARDPEANFERAIQLNPHLTAAYDGLIHVAWIRQDNRACLERGLAVARLCGDGVPELYARGQAYMLCGLPEKASPLFRSILERDPANQAALWSLVISSIFSGDRRETIRAGELYAQRFEEDPEHEYWMGVANECLGQIEMARQHYDRSMELFTEDAVTYQYVGPGKFYLRLGETKKGQEILRRGLRIVESKLRAAPENDMLKWNGLIDYYIELGAKKQARHLLADLENKYAQNQDMLLAAADWYAKLGDRGAALALIQRAMDLRVQSPTGYAGHPCDEEEAWLRAHGGGTCREGGETLRGEPLYERFIAQGKILREQALERY